MPVWRLYLRRYSRSAPSRPSAERDRLAQAEDRLADVLVGLVGDLGQVADLVGHAVARHVARPRARGRAGGGGSRRGPGPGCRAARGRSGRARRRSCTAARPRGGGPSGRRSRPCRRARPAARASRSVKGAPFVRITHSSPRKPSAPRSGRVQDRRLRPVVLDRAGRVVVRRARPRRGVGEEAVRAVVGHRQAIRPSRSRGRRRAGRRGRRRPARRRAARGRAG